jgi:cell wall-associated NlpC family hydrolase
MATAPPVYVTVRTHPEDLARATKERTPPLPFDVGWQPPSLHGIENLMLKGNTLASMIGPRLTRAVISQTLDEPLTITLDVWDKGRELLQSGLLDTKIRIALGGQAFLMTRCAKNGDVLTLEFEDAAVNQLRNFTKPMKVTRGTMSRIGFVKKLLSEKGAPRLRWVIDDGRPGAITVEKNPLALQPHEDRKPGPFQKTTVKGVQATAEQLDNMKVVLGHLFELGADTDRLILACMCVTQESTWRNTGGSVVFKSSSEVPAGLFQQKTKFWKGGGTDRLGAAKLFLDELNKVLARNVTTEKTLIIAAVQGVTTPKEQHAYAQWEKESTKTVGAWSRAYGGSQAVVAKGMYEFRRGGLDGSIEDSWECLGRLADEVQYRRFIIDGIFYFLPDELLVGTGPRLLLHETSHGMLSSIDFDVDEQVDPQTCTFSMRSEDWSVPIGACIETEKLGPGNGVWLVNKISGDLLVPHIQEIELVRPRAVLTEPPDDQTIPIDPSTEITAADVKGNSSLTTPFPTGKVSGDPWTADPLTDLTGGQRALLDEARTWLGVPYVWGGESRSGADCSGFVQSVYKNALGITLPRVAHDQWAASKVATRKDSLLAGDEVFFNWPTNRPPPPGHCGMYIGKGQFIQASTSGGVKISDLNSYIASGAAWYGYNRPWRVGGVEG